MRLRTSTSSGATATPVGGSSGPPGAGSYVAQKSTQRNGRPVAGTVGISRSPGGRPFHAFSSRQARSSPWPSVTSLVTGRPAWLGSVSVVKLTTAPPGMGHDDDRPATSPPKLCHRVQEAAANVRRLGGIVQQDPHVAEPVGEERVQLVEHRGVLEGLDRNGAKQ